MNIKTVDLITINEAAKALKQKKFIYNNGYLYGIDNIDGYIVYTRVADYLHIDYDDYFNGIIMDARELSAFVKTIGTEADFNIEFDENNLCKLSTFMNGELNIIKNDYLLSMVQSKVIKFSNIQIPSYNKGDITNEIQELYGLRKTDGCFYYKTIINNKRYIMTLFPGLLPLNKADKVSLLIYDNGIANNFISCFTVKKKKFEIIVILCYLKV